jgi:hypothetical protein
LPLVPGGAFITAPPLDQPWRDVARPWQAAGKPLALSIPFSADVSKEFEAD